MSDILYLLLGFLGFIGLFYGGNVLVKGTVQTANVLNIPAHLIAITIGRLLFIALFTLNANLFT